MKFDNNFLAWTAIFSLVGTIVAMVLWAYQPSLMVWWVTMGSLAALCGIGYSISDWLLHQKLQNIKMPRAEDN